MGSRVDLGGSRSTYLSKERSTLRPTRRQGGERTMESIVEAAVAAKRENVEKRVWAGYGVTALVTLFMAFDGISKMAVERHVVQSMTELGWPPDQTVPLGILVLGCT